MSQGYGTISNPHMEAGSLSLHLKLIACKWSKDSGVLCFAGIDAIIIIDELNVGV